MHTCPDCGSNFTRRIPRTPLMRLLHIGQHILCSHCGERNWVVFPQQASAREEQPIVRDMQQQRRKVY